MIKGLKIIAAQVNPTVGDLQGNEEQIQGIWDLWDDSADLIVFPEMVYTGYPLEDLVLRPSFLAVVRERIELFADQNKAKKSAVLIGAPWVVDGKTYNACLLIESGQIRVILKHDLPNYGVFDEARIFENGPVPDVTEFRGHKLGIMICWDFWTPKVGAHLKSQGAECLIIPNGSTYEMTKYQRRLAEAKKRSDETGLPILYLNLVGGQDEIIFDGASFAVNAAGEVSFQMKAFEEDVQLVDTSQSLLGEYPPKPKAMYQAAMLGLKDYVLKSGFKKVLLGLSGGIDSALTATIAVDAFGAENVQCVMMPSPYTSQESLEDAKALAENLGATYEIISIEPAMKSFSEMVEGMEGLTHENMQSRARGVTLMALSNQSGALLLSTGNKSEIAMGYATLYGDMCGAYNPLKDLYKMQVFALSELRNDWKPEWAEGPKGQVIPERIITKPPSAELRDNQKDEDSLPPYDVLDAILEDLIEHEMSMDEIVNKGFEKDVVQRVYRSFHMAEYKRRQSCPGANITTRPFGGRARRYPIVNKY